MGNTSNKREHQNTELFTRLQTKAVLDSLGININSETDEVFMCYCPFHGNTYSPSFAVNKTKTGACICFNESCGYTGNLYTLVSHLSNRSREESMRFIEKRGSETMGDALKEAIESTVPFEFTEWDKDVLARMQKQLWEPEGQPGLDYLHTRKLEDETVKYFGLGFSLKKAAVVTPLHSPKGMLVGVIGRSIVGKEFHNSRDLPRKETLFNLHRAKRCGDIGIVVESNLDAMLIHQAGFPNVVATLGSNLSPTNYSLLDRYFSTIIIMTDFDEKIYFNNGKRKCKRCRELPECVGHRPGRDLGDSIANALHNKNILWGVYDTSMIFPEGCKDVGDMEKAQVRQCITNAMSSYEYYLRFDDVL